jgi:hypothetical protein
LCECGSYHAGTTGDTNSYHEVKVGRKKSFPLKREGLQLKTTIAVFSQSI